MPPSVARRLLRPWSSSQVDMDWQAYIAQGGEFPQKDACCALPFLVILSAYYHIVVRILATMVNFTVDFWRRAEMAGGLVMLVQEHD